MSGLATLYFPAGVLIGMASAAPVGPVNLLVIQRSVTAHTASALVLGAAGAAGDAVFAAAAAFGMTAVAQLLAEYALVLRFGGGAIMLAFAIFIWQSTPRLRGDGEPASIVRMTLAVLTLTLPTRRRSCSSSPRLGRSGSPASVMGRPTRSFTPGSSLREPLPDRCYGGYLLPGSRGGCAVGSPIITSVCSIEARRWRWDCSRLPLSLVE